MLAYLMYIYIYKKESVLMIYNVYLYLCICFYVIIYIPQTSGMVLFQTLALGPEILDPRFCFRP